MKNMRKAFTLIELLIVVAIIAILAVVVVVALNPVELSKQSHDSRRLSDLNTLAAPLNEYAQSNPGTMGSSNITYISIPDPTATSSAGTNCAGLGGNFATTTTVFHCAGPSYYQNTNGTGWIPVNLASLPGIALSALPVDPVNTTSSNEYYTYQTDGTHFKIVAIPESQKYLAATVQNPLMFIVGTNLFYDGGQWVAVPGNATFGTSNFYVMKYDAVCSDNKGTVVNTPADGGGYNNNATACTPADGLQIAALPGGYPIVDITHSVAVSYCQSIGAHLLTNDEYMTIVTNAAEQGSNWTGGTVGSGALYIGNANNASEYPADPSDSNNYSNGTGGTMVSQTANVTGDESRTFTLSDGSVVWDLSGNVWEQVARSLSNTGDLETDFGTIPSCSNNLNGWEFCQYGNSTQPYVSAYSATVTQLMLAPPNLSWGPSQNVGEVDTYGNGTDQSTYVFLRGGSWDDGVPSPDGLFTVHMTSDGNSTDVGFRCAR